jgi:hypothetical protein
MKHCILIAIALCFLGCSNEDPAPIDSTVHLAGYLGVPDLVVGCYWKDGTYTSLTDDGYSRANSLYIDGSTVLIGGYKWGSPPQSVIWQNGVEKAIEGASGGDVLIASRNANLFGVWYTLTGPVFYKDGTTQPIIDTAYNIWPTALALLGNDMYISGCSSYHDGTKPDSPTEQHAQCWKNSQLIFREIEQSNALSIFIHHNDVYMAGYSENIVSPGNNACYWKNGQRVNLPGVHALAKSVFVTDSHVYASGVIDGQAVYWKDGVATTLTDGGQSSMAHSIFVQGADVHVAGNEHGYPAYWKNDVKQDIANQNERGNINFVVVGSN